MDDTLDVSIAGLIAPKNDEVVMAALDLITRARSVLIVAEPQDEDVIESMTFTEETDGRQALSRCIQMFATIGIECHRRMVIATKAYEELYGGEGDEAADD